MDDILAMMLKTLGRNEVKRIWLHNGAILRTTVDQRWIGFLTFGISLAFTRPQVVIYGPRSIENMEGVGDIVASCAKMGIDVSSCLDLPEVPWQPSLSPEQHWSRALVGIFQS
jgi:hypothetical protein